MFCSVAQTGTSNRVMCSLPAEPVVYSSTNAVYFPSVGTTASATNAFLSPSSILVNQLLRSTSSLRYKTDVEDLDAARATALIADARPVWYRSLADADKKEWSHYGLIAEELAEIEPRLVHWMQAEAEYETVTLPDGTTEQRETTPARLIPDGVQYDRLPVFLLHYLKQQKTMIEALRARVTALKGGTP